MMNKKLIITRFTLCSLLVAIVGAVNVHAQSISMDRGVRVEGLWCFPLVSDSLVYLYLPDRGLLAMDEQNRPQFSFMRYVNKPEETAGEPVHTISDATGGGILHFLVTYDTDERKVKRAETKLRELLSNNELKIRGPVIFKAGRYALVSSIINPDNGKEEKKLMAIGEAPVLQGSRIALSFELDPLRSSLLINSLQMSTPDVSIVFDMTFSGLMDAYKADVEVDWMMVNKNQKISTGASYYFISAELEMIYEELRQTGAVKMVTQGEDVNMQKLVDAAYGRVMDMMFQKLEPEQAKPEEQAGIMGILGKLFSNNDGGAYSSEKVYGFGAHATYKRKNIKTSGSSTLHFSSRLPTDRHHFIVFNISDFHKKYGQDPAYFNTISLDDPDYNVRQIAVGVDGSLLPEFDKMINSVTVTLRKVHQDGSSTLREINIVKSTLEKDGKIYLKYGAVGDKDKQAWMSYEYNAHFKFVGGKSWETGWIRQESGMISVYTPYERKSIRVEADPEMLNARGVRAATVKVEYPFFDGIRIAEVQVRPTEAESQKQIDITLPIGNYNYKYSIRWQMKDGTIRSAAGESDMGTLFVDAVPDK